MIGVKSRYCSRVSGGVLRRPNVSHGISLMFTGSDGPRFKLGMQPIKWTAGLQHRSIHSVSPSADRAGAGVGSRNCGCPGRRAFQRDRASRHYAREHFRHQSWASEDSGFWIGQSRRERPQVRTSPAQERRWTRWLTCRRNRRWEKSQCAERSVLLRRGAPAAEALPQRWWRMRAALGIAGVVLMASLATVPQNHRRRRERNQPENAVYCPSRQSQAGTGRGGCRSICPRPELFSKWRSCARRYAVVRCLFVGIGQRDHRRIAVGSA
jgi:hypothetical protein